MMVAPIVIALIALGLITSPAIIDSVTDIQPDSPLYSVKQIGEWEKERVGILKDKDLLDRRLTEYENMVVKGKALEHQDLLLKAEILRSKAVRAAEKVNVRTQATPDLSDDLQAIKEQKDLSLILQKHVTVLQRVMANAPPQAQPGIMNAITNSQKVLNFTEQRVGEVKGRLERITQVNLTIMPRGNGKGVRVIHGQNKAD